MLLPVTLLLLALSTPAAADSLTNACYAQVSNDCPRNCDQVCDPKSPWSSVTAYDVTVQGVEHCCHMKYRMYECSGTWCEKWVIVDIDSGPCS
jgi:hypothetical protein